MTDRGYKMDSYDHIFRGGGNFSIILFLINYPQYLIIITNEELLPRLCNCTVLGSSRVGFWEWTQLQLCLVLWLIGSRLQ